MNTIKKISERKFIRNEMNNLEYDFANVGSLYLLDVIEFICKSDDYIKLLLSLEKNVYTHIAKKYNKNIKTLKSDIAKATKKMSETREIKYPNEINDNLTTKSVISSIVENFKSNIH